MKRKGIYEFIVDDETLIKGGNELVWLMWIATELKAKTILRIHILYEKEYTYCRTIYTIISKKVWKTSSFNRWCVCVVHGIHKPANF
jgi:hypothetical protein